MDFKHHNHRHNTLREKRAFREIGQSTESGIREAIRMVALDASSLDSEHGTAVTASSFAPSHSKDVYKDIIMYTELGTCR